MEHSKVGKISETFGKGRPGVVRVHSHAVDGPVTVEVGNDGAIFHRNQGFPGNADLCKPSFAGNAGGFGFCIAVPLPVVGKLARDIVQIGDLSPAVHDDLAGVKALAVGVQMDLNGVVFPHIHIVKGAFGLAHFGGVGFTAVEEKVKVLFIGKEFDKGEDFSFIFLQGDHGDVRGIFPCRLIAFPVDFDLFAFVQHAHSGAPVIHCRIFPEISGGSIDNRSPETAADHAEPFNGSFITGSKLFRLVKESVDPFHLFGGVDLVPEFVFRRGRGHGTDVGLDRVAEDFVEPVIFQRIHDFFHGSGTGAEHPFTVLFEERRHIGGMVPHDFGKDVEVQMSEKPAVGFCFKEGAETVFVHPLEVITNGFGGEVGRRRDGADRKFGGIVPQIDFGTQLFDPVFHIRIIFRLLLRFPFLPGTGDGDLHDHIVRNGISGNIAAEVVSHHGDKAGDLLFFQAVGDCQEFLPEKVCALFGVGAPARIFAVGEMGTAFVAAAARHGVVGHQIEKGLRMRPAGVKPLDLALFNGGRP